MFSGRGRSQASGGILYAVALSKYFWGTTENRARLCVYVNTDKTWSLSSWFPIAAATNYLQLSGLSNTYFLSYSSGAGSLGWVSLSRIKMSVGLRFFLGALGSVGFLSFSTLGSLPFFLHPQSRQQWAESFSPGVSLTFFRGPSSF